MSCVVLCVFASVAHAAGDMHVLTTKYYRIHTDLDAALADDLARRMDAMYEEYSRRLVEFRGNGKQPAFEVYLFHQQSDYANFTENRLPNTGGVFMARRNLLAAFLEGQGRDAMRRTLQHEAFHQFAHTRIGPNLPVWLNEGIAQLFEEGIWTGTGFWLGQVPPRRVRQLQADMKSGDLIDFKTMLSMTHDQWSANMAGEGDRGRTQYNQSWAMVHFLVHGGEDQNPTLRRRLTNMLKLLHNGKDADEAFRQAFSDNIQGFQDRFVEYARFKLKPTPEATLIERQSILADLLTELSGNGKTFKDMAAFKATLVKGGYRLRYTKGQVQWTTEPDAATYFADLAGKPFAADQLYFADNPARPLPDIVCRCNDQIQLRTQFYKAADRIEHEVLIEPAKR